MDIKIRITKDGQEYSCKLSKGICIAMELKNGNKNARAWMAPDFEAAAVRAGDFVGSVKEGGAVNFVNVHLNPHGNGTHTEGFGHISPRAYSIHKNLKDSHLFARLVSIAPEKRKNGDRVITRKVISPLLKDCPEALIIRTKPNAETKQTRDYSNSNPPYIDPAAMKAIVKAGINHLLLDLPSVDKEWDDGKLAAHHIFWNYPKAPRKNATITELIFVPKQVKDGEYLLNLQIAPFGIDASPSRPIIFELKKEK